MHPEAVFLTGYVLSLVAAAAGIGILGRRSSDPWASKMLAAARPPTTRPADRAGDWPHSEVPVFHLGLAAVMLAAAGLLSAVSLARHHGLAEAAIQTAVLALIATRAARLHTELRPTPALPVAPGPKPVGHAD